MEENPLTEFLDIVTETGRTITTQNSNTGRLVNQNIKNENKHFYGCITLLY